MCWTILTMRTRVRQGKITRIEVVAPYYSPINLHSFLKARFQMQLGPSLTHALQQFPSKASALLQVKAHKLKGVVLTAGFQFEKCQKKRKHKHKHKQRNLLQEINQGIR